ncbi:MAG TPA: gamma-glutamyl-gamma-aminobutyrate hydrolase family protein [Planctomycetota bacterium]|nr:gamma-glutamyl-gamma-aminobutyrate hydrolase family protein [Planctomycetota bacterium]
MSEVLALQHAAPEGPGAIAGALRRRGIGLKVVRIDQGAAVPDSMGDAAGLVIMGGPMSVYEADRYPHLPGELRLIQSALDAELPVLGVCLGSQLLAAALGATVVSSGRKEIGWHEVRLGDAAKKDALWHGVRDRFMGFHWHGDIFDLPRGASPLASSALTELQAFRSGENAYGLLFHLEVGEPEIREFVKTFAEELASAKIPAGPILEGMAAHLQPLQRLGTQIFDRWTALLEARP